MNQPNNQNPSVDGYIRKNKKWQEELKEMRRIALACGLTEEIKWMVPCYTYDDNNIVLIHVFKEYCAYLFHKGVLLEDQADILVQQTKNVQSARQIRFTEVDEIIEMEHILKAYIQEAIEVEKAGLEVEFKETSEFDFPEEFQEKLDDNPELNTAFEALTPGRQRGYLLYFSGAKQSKTRTARVERYTEAILEGKGLND
jgi:uncharacterized protein YdeI (YjbR/CyaY-like superfamily)